MYAISKTHPTPNPTSDSTGTIRAGLKVRTSVKAGGREVNHNEVALKVRTGVKAGGREINHNEALVRA